MNDPFAHQQPGQSFLPVHSIAWNAMKDAGRAQLQRQLDRQAGRVEPDFNQSGIVMVRNDSGGPLGRYSVLGIDGPVFDPAGPAAEAAAFLNRVILKGVTPDAGHLGRFVVLLDPAPADGVARAYVAGVCQVLVNVIHASHTCADIVAGDADRLQSTRGGSAQMLWRQNSTGVGEQWAIIRFGNTCGSASGGGTPGRCDCPEETYEVTVACFGCAYGYGPTTRMPKYWIATILTSQGNAYYDEAYYCEGTECETLEGQSVQIENETATDPYSYEEEPTCVWSGSNNDCLTVELSGDDEKVYLRFIDANDCVIATLWMPVEEFNCCGPNLDWRQGDLVPETGLVSGQVRVRVLGCDGTTPRSGWTVAARSVSPATQITSGTTNAQGYVTLSGVPLNQQVFIRYTVPGEGALDGTAFQITHSGDVAVQIDQAEYPDWCAGVGASNEAKTLHDGPGGDYQIDDTCIITASLIPHPCTCCPEPEPCPPPDVPVCKQLVEDCGCRGDCTMSITVTDLATPPPAEPGGEVPPEEACGGMNGVYIVTRISDCRWWAEGGTGGVAAGQTTADLVYNGEWTLTLTGPDGQVAVLRTTNWNCEFAATLLLVLGESTCTVGGQAQIGVIP